MYGGGKADVPRRGGGGVTPGNSPHVSRVYQRPWQSSFKAKRCSWRVCVGVHAAAEGEADKV